MTSRLVVDREAIISGFPHINNLRCCIIRRYHSFVSRANLIDGAVAVRPAMSLAELGT